MQSDRQLEMYFGPVVKVCLRPVTVHVYIPVQQHNRAVKELDNKDCLFYWRKLGHTLFIFTKMGHNILDQGLL